MSNFQNSRVPPTGGRICRTHIKRLVDESVEEKIATAREKVAGIWGRGTTVAQTSEVRTFYAEVRSILKAALKEHIRKRFEHFAQHLTNQASAVPDRTLSEVGVQIERTAMNIRAAAEAAVAGEKETFKRISAELASAISIARTEIFALLEDEDKDEIEANQPTPLVRPQELRAAASSYASIQARATHCVKRHVLPNGAKAWPWTRIFLPEYLRGATEGWLIDPYLAKRHQRRNLDEVLVAILQGGAKLKTLHVITREVSDEGVDTDKQYYDTIDRDTFERVGMRIVHQIDPEIHDRSSYWTTASYLTSAAG